MVLPGVIAENIVLPDAECRGPAFLTFTPDGRIGEIQDVSKAPEGTPRCTWLLPGFVDIHTHGVGGNHDLCENWLNPHFSADRFPRDGTTCFLASLTFPKEHPEFVRDCIQALKDFSTDSHVGCARFGGIHAEGPVVATQGGLPEANADLSVEEFRELLDLMGDHCKVMTIAPSAEATADFKRLRLLLDRGIRPALGHDKHCSAREIAQCMHVAREYDVQLHVTHAFNVMYFHHRDPSLANFALCEKFPPISEFHDEISSDWTPLSVEVIGDFFHVHPMNISLLLHSRSHDNVAFITDSMMAFEPNNEAVYCGRPVMCDARRTQDSVQSGVMVLKETKTIAGSCCTMMHNFKNLVSGLGVPVPDASRMLSEVPARIADLRQVGQIKEGKWADVLMLDEALNLQQTIISGEVAYEATVEM